VQTGLLNLPSDVTCKFGKSTITLDGINPVTASLTLKVGAAAVPKPIAITVTATARTDSLVGIDH